MKKFKKLIKSNKASSHGSNESIARKPLEFIHRDERGMFVNTSESDTDSASVEVTKEDFKIYKFPKPPETISRLKDDVILSPRAARFKERLAQRKINDIGSHVNTGDDITARIEDSNVPMLTSNSDESLPMSVDFNEVAVSKPRVMTHDNFESKLAGDELHSTKLLNRQINDSDKFDTKTDVDDIARNSINNSDARLSRRNSIKSKPGNSDADYSEPNRIIQKTDFINQSLVVNESLIEPAIGNEVGRVLGNEIPTVEVNESLGDAKDSFQNIVYNEKEPINPFDEELNIDGGEIGSTKSSSEYISDSRHSSINLSKPFDSNSQNNLQNVSSEVFTPSRISRRNSISSNKIEGNSRERFSLNSNQSINSVNLRIKLESARNDSNDSLSIDQDSRNSWGSPAYSPQRESRRKIIKSNFTKLESQSNEKMMVGQHQTPQTESLHDGVHTQKNDSTKKLENSDSMSSDLDSTEPKFTLAGKSQENSKQIQDIKISQNKELNENIESCKTIKNFTNICQTDLPPKLSSRRSSKVKISNHIQTSKLPPLPIKRDSSVESTRRQSTTEQSIEENFDSAIKHQQISGDNILKQQRKSSKAQKDLNKKKLNSAIMKKLKLDIDTFTNEPSDDIERSVSRGRRSKRDKKEKKSIGLKHKENATLQNITQKIDVPEHSPQREVDTLKNEIVSIKIHSADSLGSQMDLRHPVVKVHIVDTCTGKYLLKSNIKRSVTFPSEPANIDFILPTLTKPYYLLKNKTKTPIWDEVLLFNDSYSHIIHSNVVVFFEILDFLTTNRQIKRHGDKWQRIGWAFMKLIGNDGKSNVGPMGRLQLFRYPSHLAYEEDVHTPFVYKCWQEDWIKYPSTLFVTVSGHGEIKQPTKKYFKSELKNKMKKYGTETFKSMADLVIKMPKWPRKKDEICKLPNKLLYKINAGQKGTFACSFSNSGIFLAVASISPTCYPIKIYQFETGERLATLEGHLDLVYQLAWSNDDRELISSSSDGSVRVWGFMADGSVQQIAIFLHPSYVYCASFHPTKNEPGIIASGCFDGHVRLWKHTPNTKSKSNKPFLKLEGHFSNVNALCFGKDGHKLYSGDGSGLIKVWVEAASAQDELSYEVIATINTLVGDPIQCLKIHNNNRKLLVQTAGPKLHMLDTRIHRFLTHFVQNSTKSTHVDGIPNGKLSVSRSPTRQRRSISRITTARFFKACFSACGEYVFVGSRMGQVHVWRSESGAYIGEYKNTLGGWPTTDSPIVDICFHPHDHVIAFSVWGEEEPVMVYTWDENEADIKSAKSNGDLSSKKHLDVDKMVAKSLSSIANF